MSITNPPPQSGNKYLRFSISSSGSSTFSSFFFFSLFITDRAMIGRPFLFSRSGSVSAFCFRVFYCSYSSFFYLFRSLFRAIHSFSRTWIAAGFSSFVALRNYSCFSILSYMSLSS